MLDRPFRILLIEDNPGDARLMQEYLAGASSCSFDLHWSDTVAKGLDALGRLQPDIIVLDLNLPDSSGLNTFYRVHEHAGTIPVLVLTGMDDESLAIEAMQKGAQDYLVKGEVRGAALVRAVRYAIERDRAGKAKKTEIARKARVLGFVGAKGGVGTSSVAVNVASALAQANRTVILAELRPWPGTVSHDVDLLSEAAPAAGPEAAAAPFDLTSRLAQLPSGVRVLVGPKDYEHAQTMEPYQVEAVIRALEPAAEQLILDIVPYPPATARAAFQLCDFTGIVSETDPVSLACARKLAVQLEAWGIDHRRIGLIAVNRASGAEATPQDLRAASACEVLGIIPSAADEFAAATRSGTPVVIGHPQSNCAAALVDLASRLAGEPVVSLFV